MSQCSCLTLKGTQCARKAKEGSKYCVPHKNCSTSKSSSSSSRSKKQMGGAYDDIPEEYMDEVMNPLLTSSELSAAEPAAAELLRPDSTDQTTLPKVDPLSDPYTHFSSNYNGYEAIKCLELAGLLATGPCTTYFRENDPESWTTAASGGFGVTDGSKINWLPKQSEYDIASNLTQMGFKYKGCMTVVAKYTTLGFARQKNTAAISALLTYNPVSNSVYVIFSIGARDALGLSASSMILHGQTKLNLKDMPVDDCRQYTSKNCETNSPESGCKMGKKHVTDFKAKCRKNPLDVPAQNNAITSDSVQISTNIMEIYNQIRDRLLAKIYLLKTGDPDIVGSALPLKFIFGGHGYSASFATLCALDLSIVMERNQTEALSISGDVLTWSGNNLPVVFDVMMTSQDIATDSQTWSVTRNRGQVIKQSNNICVYATASYGFGNKEFCQLVDSYVPLVYNITNKLDTVVSSIGVNNRPGVTIKFSHSGSLTIRDMFVAMHKKSSSAGMTGLVKGIESLDSNGTINKLSSAYKSLAPATSRMVISLSSAIPGASVALSIVQYLWLLHLALRAHSQASYLVGLSVGKYNVEIFAL